MVAAIWPDAFVLWGGVICTLAIFSLLYKENPVYRVFEYLFVGLATGYSITQVWQDILKPKWWDPLYAGQWWMIFPVLLGLLYYTTYIRRISWMNRLLIGALMGFGAGLTFQGFASQYGPQIGASFVTLLPGRGLTAYQLINNWIVTLTLIAVMTYFFFAFEQKNKGVQATAKIGRWLLMVSFGAIFGQTVMARMALATKRLDFLLNGTGLVPHIKHFFGG
jgi:hypothetical protein